MREQKGPSPAHGWHAKMGHPSVDTWTRGTPEACAGAVAIAHEQAMAGILAHMMADGRQEALFG